MHDIIRHANVGEKSSQSVRKKKLYYPHYSQISRGLDFLSQKYNIDYQINKTEKYAFLVLADKSGKQ